MKDIRLIAWMKGALREFKTFPEEAREDIEDALTLAALGDMPPTAKPLKGVGSGVFEIALKHRSDAFRAIDAVQIDDALWVIDAFQKKSKSGIKTPQADVDRIKERLKRLKEILR